MAEKEPPWPKTDLPERSPLLPSTPPDSTRMLPEIQPLDHQTDTGSQAESPKKEKKLLPKDLDLAVVLCSQATVEGIWALAGQRPQRDRRTA